ncbi:MAG: hypothetical protein V1839_02270 [archaeon]
MANKAHLDCFFCGGEIPAITRTEIRHNSCHECSGEYNVNVIIPAESNICTVKFEPAYTLLKEDFQKAEEKTQKIIARAIAASNTVLKPFMKKLSSVDLSVREWRCGMRSPEEIRNDNARQFYELAGYGAGFCGYNIESFLVEPEGFKAHNSCVKKELTLEELANNPLIKVKFKQQFAGLPKPYQQLYGKLKSEKVDVIVKEFDPREYL